MLYDLLEWNGEDLEKNPLQETKTSCAILSLSSRTARSSLKCYSFLIGDVAKEENAQEKRSED